uniref:Uncharacterized protein n=1 Tax=Anopheles farauti TaxID=69004 RepID=A0A182QJP4_9DIPT
MENDSCYGGGDIAGAIFGTLFAVVLVAVLLWWLYKKNLILKRKANHHHLENAIVQSTFFPLPVPPKIIPLTLTNIWNDGVKCFDELHKSTTTTSMGPFAGERGLSGCGRRVMPHVLFPKSRANAARAQSIIRSARNRSQTEAAITMARVCRADWDV